MEAIKMSGVAHGGVLTLKVPEDLDDQELEITILSLRDKQKNADVEDEQRNEHEEKVKRLKNIIGKAKYPDFPITKYDVYNQ